MIAAIPTSREDSAFKVPCYSALQRAGGDFGCWRSRERECGYSLAFSIAPNAALSQPLYYDRRRLKHRLAQSRYASAFSLIWRGAECACRRVKLRATRIPFISHQPVF
jgi:hypothetical protein